MKNVCVSVAVSLLIISTHILLAFSCAPGMELKQEEWQLLQKAVAGCRGCEPEEGDGEPW